MSCDVHTCLRSLALASLRAYGTQHDQSIGLPQRRLFPLQSTAHCDEADYCFGSCMAWYHTSTPTPHLHMHHEFIGPARRNGFPQPSTARSRLKVILLHQDGYVHPLCPHCPCITQSTWIPIHIHPEAIGSFPRKAFLAFFRHS